MAEEHHVDGDLVGLVEEAHDSLCGGVHRCGNDCEHLRRIDFHGGTAPEPLHECRVVVVALLGAFVVVGSMRTRTVIDRLWDDSGGSSEVERLRDDVTRCPVALQFEDVDRALRIDGQQVDEPTVGRGHLPSDQQQRFTQDRRIRFDVVLKLGLKRNPTRVEASQSAAVSSPQSHFQGHM